MVGTNGSITSPNYPFNYGNNANCEWRIRVPAGLVVLLRFDSFDLESGQNCRYDAVELRDSPSSVIGSFCGTKRQFSIMSSGETLFVKFRSDRSQTRKGFSAKFTAIARPTNPPLGKNRGLKKSIYRDLSDQEIPSDNRLILLLVLLLCIISVQSCKICSSFTYL